MKTVGWHGAAGEAGEAGKDADQLTGPECRVTPPAGTDVTGPADLPTRLVTDAGGRTDAALCRLTRQATQTDSAGRLQRYVTATKTDRWSSQLTCLFVDRNVDKT